MSELDPKISALDNLRVNQTRLDEAGLMVGVSRKALNDAIRLFDKLNAEFSDLEAQLAQIDAMLDEGQGDDDGAKIMPDFEPGMTTLAKVEACTFLLEKRRDVIEAMEAQLAERHRVAHGMNMATLEAKPEEPSQLVQEAIARYEALSPEAKAAHDEAQRESFLRGFAPCEHGNRDWETCPLCRGDASKAIRILQTSPVSPLAELIAVQSPIEPDIAAAIRDRSQLYLGVDPDEPSSAVTDEMVEAAWEAWHGAPLGNAEAMRLAIEAALKVCPASGARS